MPKKHIDFLVAAAGVTALGIMLSLTPDRVEATRPPGKIETLGTSLNTLAPAKSGVAESDVPNSAEQSIDETLWQTVKVRHGDSLARIFNRLGFSAAELQEVVALDDVTRQLKHLYPGEIIKVKATPEGQLQAFDYDIDDSQSLHIYRVNDALHAKLVEHVLDRQIKQATGVIDSSLFLAAQQAGLSENVTMQLADIFGWDVDFALDIRQGDSFAVVYDEYYRYGKKVRDGDIIAAEFTNRGNTFKAVRYTDPEGFSEYFTPDGKSVRKAFLRTPVNFTHISSRFDLHRKHPILNRIRAHKGVDYAAPVGTPIKATGEGKVVFKGTNGGFGRMIKIQHGQTYTTVYAHMSRYAMHIHSGSHVRQGQIIGYVGMTGLATGPHLHYEFRVNGVHRNPLTVKLPDAAPINVKYKMDFFKQTQPLVAQLDLLQRTAVALNQ